MTAKQTIYINGEALIDTHTAIQNVEQALAHYFKQQEQSTFAVALNGDFVGKEDYATTVLASGDSIDILFPIQGG